MQYWWNSNFSEDYYELYRYFFSDQQTKEQVFALINTTGLKKGDRILDLGCGYGRHSVVLARKGFNVIGIDTSRYLLEKIPKTDGLTVYNQDMRRLNYSRQFDVVASFFTSFGYFSDEDNKKVLIKIKKALKPGGTFFLDLANPNNISQGVSEQVMKNGDEIKVDSKVDFLNGIWKMKKTLRKNSKELFFESITRVYSLPEIKILLESIGFEIKKCYGGYDLGEVEADSQRIIIICQEPF